MKKKILIITLVICMSFIFTGCKDNANEVVKVKPMIVMLTGIEGIGDQSFNDAIWASLEKAQEEEDVEIRCMESKSKKGLEANVKTAALENPALIICAGAEFNKIINKDIKEFKDTRFLLVDEKSGSDKIASISFAENESGFLAGVAAAMNTKSNVVGFVGGEKRKNIEKFDYGFAAGAQSVKKDIKVVKSYTGNFIDKNAGYEAAKDLKAEGADVIFQAAGLGGLGVIDFAGDSKIWAIGVDKDQSMLDSKYVLCSAVKNFDEGIAAVVKDIAKERWNPEEKVYTLKEKGVGISDRAGNLNQETKEAILKWTKAIIDGEVKVPSTLADLENYQTPEI